MKYRNSVAGNLHMIPLARGGRPSSARILLLLLIALSFTGGTVHASDGGALVREVAAVGMTVSDMDRAVAFYSRVLCFDKISDAEIWGDDYEHLEGIFGLR